MVSLEQTASYGPGAVGDVTLTCIHYSDVIMSVSNHRRLDCLPNRLFRCRSKKISKLRVTGLCEGNPPVTGGFPSQRVSDAENFPFDDVIIGCAVYMGTHNRMEPKHNPAQQNEKSVLNHC